MKQIAASIKKFGFVNPVLIDGMNGIVAGHARVKSARLLGMTDIPTVCVDHFTPAQVRAYVIADNRLAELAGWDRALLAIELQELSVEAKFDVTVTGFETAQIDLLINEIKSGQQDGLMAFRRSTVRLRRSPARAIYGKLATTCFSVAMR